MELQIFDPAFQGDDPPVEEFLGTYDLTAEVVDDERAAEGFDVQRGLVELRQRIEAEVEHLQRQLAAGDDEWPPTGDPSAGEILAAQGRALIGRIGCALDGDFVDARVEDLDDLSLDLKAV